MSCVTHCNDAVILAVHEWHSKSQTARCWFCGLWYRLLMFSLPRSEDLSSVTVTGRSPICSENNLASMEGRTGACSSFGRFVLFVFCSTKCETAWTWIWGSVQIHLSYPVLFNHGAKGICKGEKSPLTETALQAGKKKLSPFINNTYWMFAKPQTYLK